MAMRLTGRRKAAILLLSMGEDGAAEILRNLSDEEIQALSQEMQAVTDADPTQVDRVMNEYYLVAEKGRFLPGPPKTKIDYLKTILGKGLGEDKAENLVEGLIANRPTSTLEQLKWHDPLTIAEFIGAEHPQVVAVILANLGDPALAQQVLQSMPPEQRGEVMGRLARIRDIPQEWLDEIESSLSAEKAVRRPTTGARGGQGQVAGMLDAAAPGMEARLMAEIERKNPDLARAISDNRLAFADLIKIDNYGIQLILKKVPGDDLVMALKLADEPITRHMLRGMPSDSARSVQQAVDALGPVPIRNIEAAQRRIALIARELLDKGEAQLLERRGPPNPYADTPAPEIPKPRKTPPVAPPPGGGYPPNAARQAPAQTQPAGEDLPAHLRDALGEEDGGGMAGPNAVKADDPAHGGVKAGQADKEAPPAAQPALHKPAAPPHVAEPEPQAD